MKKSANFFYLNPSEAFKDSVICTEREIDGSDVRVKLCIAKPILASEETVGVLPW